MPGLKAAIVTAPLLLLTLSAQAAEAPPPIEPGAYEQRYTVTQMAINNKEFVKGPASMPRVEIRCLGAGEARAPVPHYPAEPGRTCTPRRTSWANGQINVAVDCTANSTKALDAVFTIAGTYGPKTFTYDHKLTTVAGSVRVTQTWHVDAQHIGACAPGDVKDPAGAVGGFLGLGNWMERSAVTP